MGRPKEFDREEVLDLAVDVFRGNGFKGTSMQDLLAGMGINRSSFYDTFGDKHQLFLEAFDRYAKRRRDQLCAVLGQAGPRKPLIRLYFEDLIDEVLTYPVTGCLLINSAVEFAAENPAVADRLLSSFNLTENLFFETLVEAQRTGELSAQKDSRALAKFLVSSMRGIRLTAKVARRREDLRQIVDITLSVLDQAA